MWQGSRKKKIQLSLGNKATNRRSTKQKTRLTPRSKLRQDRSRKRLYVLFGVAAALILVLAGLSFLSFAKKLSIRELNVSGQQKVHPLAIQARAYQRTAGAYLGLFSQQNVLLYPENDLEKLLLFEFPRIETIDVERHVFKRNIEVAIVERLPHVLWCREVSAQEEEEEDSEDATKEVTVEEECFLVDRTGVLFSAASGDETLIKLYGGVKHPEGAMLRKSVEPSHFQDVVALLSSLQELDLHVTSITFKEDEAEIIIAPGWKLLLTLSKDTSVVPINLSTVLDENELGSQLHTLNYIDLRFDDRVYYKLIE